MELKDTFVLVQKYVVFFFTICISTKFLNAPRMHGFKFFKTEISFYSIAHKSFVLFLGTPGNSSSSSSPPPSPAAPPRSTSPRDTPPPPGSPLPSHQAGESRVVDRSAECGCPALPPAGPPPEEWGMAKAPGVQSGNWASRERLADAAGAAWASYTSLQGGEALTSKRATRWALQIRHPQRRTRRPHLRAPSAHPCLPPRSLPTSFMDDTFSLVPRKQPWRAGRGRAFPRFLPGEKTREAPGG